MNRHVRHTLCAAAVLCAAVFSRCANVVAPEGGPRDSLPPVVRAVTPAGGRNFTARRIFIEFDEYVQLQGQSNEFYTSPLMKTKPTLSIRGRGVRIDIKDTLPPNRTYSLNFGSSIRDNNEGNPLHGFRYVFSTGAGIDSLLLTGYAADAMRGDSVSKAFVFFYDAKLDSIPDYDSLLLKHEPSAVGRAENNGIFIAQNLKEMPYRVYAFADANNNQRYDPGTDRVGFLDSVVNPAAMPSTAVWRDEYRRYPTADPQVYFRLFAEATARRQNLTASERPGRHQAVLRFAAPRPVIDTLDFEGIPRERIIREYPTPGRDTIVLWFDMPPEALGDTIKGRISYHRPDSMGVMAPFSQALRLAWRKPAETREEARERERQEREAERAAERGEQYTPPEVPNPFRFRVDAGAEINPEKSIPIEFDLPLTSVDSARITLMTVPELGDPAPVPLSVARDTTNIRRWILSAAWDEAQSYRLNVPAGVFVNVAGESNDSLGANFKIQHRSRFATLSIDVRGRTDSAKYIIQVLDGSGKTLHERKNISTGRLEFPYLPEGEVQVRVTEDGNGNGQWDPGSLVERRQPERTEFYLGATGDKLIATAPGREIPVVLDMALIFAPVSIEKIKLDLQRAEDARVQKYLEEKAERDAQRARQGTTQGVGAGGLGIGSALGGARQQIQSTVR